LGRPLVRTSTSLHLNGPVYDIDVLAIAHNFTTNGRGIRQYREEDQEMHIRNSTQLNSTQYRNKVRAQRARHTYPNTSHTHCPTVYNCVLIARLAPCATCQGCQEHVKYTPVPPWYLSKFLTSLHASVAAHGRI
jgi:hypothetical protein